MEKVQLLFDKSHNVILHYIHLLTGFAALNRQNVISLSFDFDNDIKIPIPNTFCAIINDQMLYFDVSDGSDNFLLNEQKRIFTKK